MIARSDTPRKNDVGLLNAGQSLNLPIRACDSLAGFRIGQRYLVSVDQLHRPDSGAAAAWVLTGSRARFLVMHEDRKFDPRFSQATTLSQAIALVAPGATLPPTSTFDPVSPATGGGCLRTCRTEPERPIARNME